MIDSILHPKHINYASNLNDANLKQKIETVFNQGALNFVGKFTSQNEFSAYDKWSVVTWYVPNFKRKAAYLTGTILKSEHGSLLKLNIKPNTLLSVVSLLSLVVGIFIIIAAGSNTRFLIIGSFIALVGILYYAIGIFSIKRLRSSFETALDLQKV
ncbi:hypothetical protein [Gelidibacter mesophilus]|uniref:hypothetical protein n=1 Tax=Gelidibacter mesophilus TaxID=169050 RepID=UPI000413170E|nr:hypothetical protein [Gelidibacter mesophilus]